MIVVDTTTIAYLYLPAPGTPDVERLLELDSVWAAPRLWRSELRSVLTMYLRRHLLDFTTACQIQNKAETLMAGNEYDVDSLGVLAVAHESGCSAYDSEFVALAQSLGKKLITADKKLLRASPDNAMTVKDFISKA
jgi:predicted nucleic acid-binding protein